MPSRAYTTSSRVEDTYKQLIGMAPLTYTLAAPPPPPPPPLYIGLGQREAQVNHELLFNHA